MSKENYITLREATGIRISNLLIENNMTLSQLDYIIPHARNRVYFLKCRGRNNTDLGFVYDCCKVFNITLKQFFDDKLFDYVDKKC